MESLSQRLQSSMKESRRLWFDGERATAERLLQEHKAIFAGIQLQDETTAYSGMLDHLSKVEKVLELSRGQVHS